MSSAFLQAASAGCAGADGSSSSARVNVRVIVASSSSMLRGCGSCGPLPFFDDVRKVGICFSVIALPSIGYNEIENELLAHLPLLARQPGDVLALEGLVQ